MKIRGRYRAFPITLGRAVDVAMADGLQAVATFAEQAAWYWGVRYGVYDGDTLIDVSYPTVTAVVHPVPAAKSLAVRIPADLN